MDFDHHSDIGYCDRPGTKITVEFHPHAARPSLRGWQCNASYRNVKGHYRFRAHFSDHAAAFAFVYLHSDSVICVYRPTNLGKQREPSPFDGMKSFRYRGSRFDAAFDALDDFVAQLDDVEDMNDWRPSCDTSARVIDRGWLTTPQITDGRVVNIIGPNWGLDIAWNDCTFELGTHGDRDALWRFLTMFKLSGGKMEPPELTLAA